MTREEAMERIEFRIKRHCIEANEDSGGKCGECWRYPCDDMKAFLSINEERPHGEWEFIGENLFKCTLCGYIADADYLRKWKVHTYDAEFPTACLKCGADMRKER